jgi:hypothetical protein
MFCALREGAVEKALFVGGSNAGKLAAATSMLGVDVFKLASGGWKFSQESVDALLPELTTQLESLPADIPVFFGLDNSAFTAAADDGSMSPLKKMPEAGPGYHAVGKLIIAPDRSLSNPISNLKRLVTACGDRAVFIISPIFRFVLSPCCGTAGHMSIFNDPDYVKTLLKDLNLIRLLLRSNFPSQTVVDGMELFSGAGFNLEKAESAARVAWITDPVHPSGHTVAKMALNLLEAMAPSGKTTAPSGQKRKRDESDSGDASDGGGSGNRSKERARAWSASGRGTSYEPTPRGNNRQYGHQQPARGRGYGERHFQPYPGQIYLRGRGTGGGRGGGGGHRG